MTAAIGIPKLETGPQKSIHHQSWFFPKLLAPNSLKLGIFVEFPDLEFEIRSESWKKTYA
jgi:hypothetical protein